MPNRCPHCGFELMENDRFCVHCGQPVPPPRQEMPPAPVVQPAPPPIPAPVRAKQVKCPACGKKNAGDMAFCIHCGSKMILPPAPPPGWAPEKGIPREEEGKEKKQKVLIPLLIILAMLLVTAAGLLFAFGVIPGGSKDTIALPTATPAPVYTAVPTKKPTAAPTVKPTATPTPVPTKAPTPVPTATPTPRPTATPTVKPTVKPTATPRPTVKPTAVPTAEPVFTTRLSAPIRARGTGVNKNAPVYSGPGTQYYRAANGKASVDFKESIQIWGEENGWLMISYDVTSGVDRGNARVGYVQLSQVPSSMKNGYAYGVLRLEKRSATLTVSTPIRDSSNTGMTAAATLKAGTKVTYLATYATMDYVECTLNGKKMRGFIPTGLLQAD
ncbi:MAG: zinc-ribbon domain-containing protein [Clostridia bacterium]|nr:zinc-ribbon domain-containing protein [Clostridia bacterium]